MTHQVELSTAQAITSMSEQTFIRNLRKAGVADTVIVNSLPRTTRLEIQTALATESMNQDTASTLVVATILDYDAKGIATEGLKEIFTKIKDKISAIFSKGDGKGKSSSVSVISKDHFTYLMRAIPEYTKVVDALSSVKFPNNEKSADAANKALEEIKKSVVDRVNDHAYNAWRSIKRVPGSQSGWSASDASSARTQYNAVWGKLKGPLKQLNQVCSHAWSVVSKYDDDDNFDYGGDDDSALYDFYYDFAQLTGEFGSTISDLITMAADALAYVEALASKED